MALFVGITGLISVLVGWLVTRRLIMTNEGALFFAIGSIGMVIGITALGRFPRVAFRPNVAVAKLFSRHYARWWLAFFMPDAYRIHVLGADPNSAAATE